VYHNWYVGQELNHLSSASPDPHSGGERGGAKTIPPPNIDLETQRPSAEQKLQQYPLLQERVKRTCSIITPIRVRSADRLDHHTNQGEVSGHADHGAHQNSKTAPTRPPPNTTWKRFLNQLNYKLSDLGEVPKVEGVNSNQKIPFPSGEGQTDRLDHYANQGEVSRHADYYAHQGEVR